jgi:PPOX class probable F420-dependent enzyme
MKSLEQFSKQKYLNLETFRKSGQAMRTPVWFVQDDEIIYVQTMANSGKVKRICNNCMVNIAPCKMDGKLIGSWVPAQARQVTDPTVSVHADYLLDKKYGLLKKCFQINAPAKAPKISFWKSKFLDRRFL